MGIRELPSKKGNVIVWPIASAVVPMYIIAIAGAELLGLFLGVVPSVILHSVLLLALLNQYAWQKHASYWQVLPVLALAPLMRILSLTMPIGQLPQIYWYAMIGLPLMLAIVLTIRQLDLSRVRLGLYVWSLPPQLLIALSGFPLSIGAYLILRPKPLAPEFGWFDLIIGSIILMLFTGVTEELLFRGMFQQIAKEAFGTAGIFYSSALFAVMYIGLLSWTYCFFIGSVGVFFGWCVHRTGSIWGVMLAHGIMNIGLILVWPRVGGWLNTPLMQHVASALHFGLWMLAALALGAAVLLLIRQVQRLIMGRSRPTGQQATSNQTNQSEHLG